MAVLFDKDGNVLSKKDLQDKAYWCKEGLRMEEAFVKKYGNKLRYTINPSKKANKYAPDLISTRNGIITDLKSQHTPFFKADIMYGIDPRYAVVFNGKDKLRYQRNCYNIEIVYFVDWVAVAANINEEMFYVESLLGIYKIPFLSLLKILDPKKIHYYNQRKWDDKGNAKYSYVVDIRNEAFERLL